jgi:S1-C subfamily serine protease
VAAIGSPFGQEQSLSVGVVSATDRSIQSLTRFTIDGAIQTDAALNQGNSGGPLLDAAGRVVGMNAQIATDSGASAGIGYAIPIETVREIARQLEENGAVEHAYLGVVIEDGPDGGARVVEVAEDSPASRAGLRADDVVVRAGDEDVGTADELRRLVASRRPGDELGLEVRRGERDVSVVVELGTRPRPSE